MECDWRRQLRQRLFKLNMSRLELSVRANCSLDVINSALFANKSLWMNHMVAIAGALGFKVCYVDDEGRQVSDLKAERKRQGLQYKTMVMQFNMSGATFSRVLRGENASTYTIERILEMLGLKIILIDK